MAAGALCAARALPAPLLGRIFSSSWSETVGSSLRSYLTRGDAGAAFGRPVNRMDFTPAWPARSEAGSWAFATLPLHDLLLRAQLPSGWAKHQESSSLEAGPCLSLACLPQPARRSDGLTPLGPADDKCKCRKARTYFVAAHAPEAAPGSVTVRSSATVLPPELKSHAVIYARDLPLGWRSHGNNT